MNHSKSAIEHIVESIKSYFSISGLIIIGVYLVTNAHEAALGIRSLNYVSGVLAILVGSVTGIWYSCHLVAQLMANRSRRHFNTVEVIIYGSFVVIAFLIITSIILGSVSSSCGTIFGSG